MKRSIELFSSLALGLVLMPVSILTAATWTGANSTDWNDGGNWIGGMPNSVTPAAFSGSLPSYGITYTPPNGWAAFAQSLTFNANANLSFGMIGGPQGSIGVDGWISQNGASFVFIRPDFVCGSPFTLGGGGAGPVHIQGAFLGNPSLTVTNGDYHIGPGNAGAGITFQSINITGGTLEIGVSNNVTVSGPVQVDSGGTLRLCNPGIVGITFSAPTLTVNGTLWGNATVSATTVVSGGGTIHPGCSASTLSIVGNLTLAGTAVLHYELDTAGVVGGGVNDLIDVTGNLDLAGILNVIPLGGFGPGTYRLFNYSGTLSGSGLTLGSLPAGYDYAITAMSGEVNLVVSLDTTPPVIASPTNGQNFMAGGNTTVQATTPDPSTISFVDFHFDGTLIFHDTTSPYTYVQGALPPGLHTLLAVMRGTNGMNSTSAPVTITVTNQAGVTVLVAHGSDWKYLDDGSDQGTAWQSPAFDDSGWASGPGELGFGDTTDNPPRPERTVINGGPATNRNATTYFRHAFTVSNPGAYSELLVRLRRDDGGVVYLNDVEVFRSNMPTGVVDFLTLTGVSAPDDGTAYFSSTNLSPALLVAGQNLLAVEIHQDNLTSSDLSFDAMLQARVTDTAPPTLVSAAADCASNKVTVTFSEPVNQSDAQNLASYSVPGLTLLSAMLSADGRTVMLLASSLASGGPFTVTVNNVRDRASVPNVIAANSQLSFSCPTPPVITQQPQSLTVTQGQTATFTVRATGAAPLTYHWRRNSAHCCDWSSNDFVALLNVQPADAGDYDVIVSNSLGTATSAPATLTVVPDTFPPTLVSAAANCTSNKVTVTFSEPLDPLTAAETFNFIIAEGITVQSAMLSADGKTICLFSDPISSGVTYTLIVDFVMDLAGNPIESSSQISFACASPPVLKAFINEWLADNVNGIVDPVDGQHDDWFEIHNPGTNAVDLAGRYLTDWSSNDFKFLVPSGYSVPAGGYLRVWADNQPEQNTNTSPDLHVNFTLAAGGGNIGLYAADGTAIDAISFGPQSSDASEGRFPDGGTNRYRLTRTTPGAPNASPKLFINEWLADNVNGIVDPIDGQHDDWFEIYNPSGSAVGLRGFYLTDWSSNDFRFLIPAGYSVPAGGYLRVWADNQPEQNTTSPDLHVNFTFAAGGGTIGLYAPDGTAIDAITFGPQTADVSEGRWPAGGNRIYRMEASTPGADNAFPDTTPPVITLNGPATMTLCLGSPYTEPGATASDNLDSSVTVIIGSLDPKDQSGQVNVNSPGTYVVPYNATDASGNAAVQVTRTVIVLPKVQGGTATAIGTPICPGSSETVSWSGPAGTLILKWQTSPNGKFDWTDIPSTDNPLNVGPLTADAFYRAVVQEGFCVGESSVATIYVRDVTLPAINCPAPISVPATGPSGAVVHFNVTATDNCDPNPMVQCTPASGTTFAIGSTLVTCSARDASGNEISTANGCVVPDNGGTAVLPPASCQYVSQFPNRIDVVGAPHKDTYFQLSMIHRAFVCQSGVVCVEAGGSLGGEIERSSSVLDLGVDGGGNLPGWHRVISLPVTFETHAAPRTLGDAVQSFNAAIVQLQGQITGDPDFDLLRITAGSVATPVLPPSSGHTTLTSKPGVGWAVDSYFDLRYRIEYVGSANGALAGLSGSATAVISLRTGNPACTFTVTVMPLSDTTPPAITICPPGGNLGCNPATAPDCATVSALVTATDDSGVPPVLNCTSTDSTSGCTVTRTFTITATDGAGNTTPVPCVVVYTWTVDATPPVFVNCPPPTLDLGCNPTSIPDCDPSVTATDNCTAFGVRDLLVSSRFSDEVKRFGGISGTYLGNIAFGNGLDGPRGLALGPNGLLYVASGESHEVKRFNPVTGTFVDTIVAAGAGGLDLAHSIVVKPNGEMFVTGLNNDRVKHYNANGAYLGDFTSAGSGLSGAHGLVFGPDGNLYVCSWDTDQVLRYDGSSGQFLGVFASGHGLDGPYGLVFGPDGNLYVTSQFSDEVKRFNASGAFVDNFVTAGSGGLVQPRGLVFGPEGKLYVSSGFTDEVKRYHGTSGAFLDTFASGGGLDVPTLLLFIDPAQPVITCAKVDTLNGCARTRTLTYTATDHCGNSRACTQVITWKVDTTPPLMSQPPQDQLVCAGKLARFSVSASGCSPLSYQWHKNGGIISGAISPILSIPNAQAADAGTYSVMISDACGLTTSASAVLSLGDCGTIRGRIWKDLNFDCVQGGGETPLQGWGVRLNGGTHSTLTDLQGNYSFNVPAGTYTVTAVRPNSTWVQICPVAPSYTLSLSSGQNVARPFAFREPASGNCPDLWVDVTPIYPGPKRFHIRGPSTPCCGNDFTYNIRYGNRGDVASSPAMISFQYSSSLCTILSVGSTCGAVPHFQAAPGLEIFNLPSLPPYSSCRIAVKVHLSCNITTLCANQPPIYAQATITQFPYIPECNNHLADNFSAHAVKPCCSSDPNDCTVTPKGCGPEGLIRRDQALTYLVQFQNEGGGFASQVVVQDVLDPDLDMDTLEVLGSSHDYFLETNGRELVWIFPDIGLAPQALDEPASHGFVKFRIRPRADAPVATVITNSAAIYFDYNEPVVTSTTTNTITEDPVPIAAFTAALQGGPGTSVYDFAYTGGTPGAQFVWNFGPNAVPSTSTAANPTGVMFTTPGPHLVGLDVNLGACAAEPAVQVLTLTLPPITGGNGAATTIDSPVNIAKAKLLANDMDPNGDALTIGAAGTISVNGGVVILGASSLTYTPPPGFTGTDRFTYTVSDGHGGIAVGSVDVLVVDGNLPSLNQVSLEVLANGNVRVRFAGIPGHAYQIQRATTLPGPWTILTTKTAPMHGIVEFVDPVPPGGAAFYRTAAP